MKTCTVCSKEFEPTFNSMQAVCSPRCAGRVGKIKRKAQARTLRDRREAMKTLPELKKEAQEAFNAYIRERDKDLPCICCGQWPKGAEALTGGQWDAGHLRGRGANPELAFHEMNVHRQLKSCNRGDWDRVEYEKNVVARYGQAVLDELKGYHPPIHRTRSDMRDIREHYKQRLRDLQKERE